MTATTLVNGAALSAGNTQLVKTALQSGTTAASLLASVTTAVANNTQTTVLKLWFAVLNDIGTFNAAAIAQLKSMAEEFELTVGNNNSDVRWSKIKLFAVDGAVIYTWFEGAGFDASGMTASLFMREYP
jgi:hypothetical protein